LFNVTENDKMNSPDFEIKDTGPISKEFLKNNITNFRMASLFIKELPYKRNKNKDDLLSIFSDGCGTCSTKHALLKKLADENGFKNIQLILGIFKMNTRNTPSVKQTLGKYKLEYIPEAHNYLRYKNEIIDCTKRNWKASDFENDILVEIEILPEQITVYKVAYHKEFLRGWLKKNNGVPYNIDELWEIREQCIKELSN